MPSDLKPGKRRVYPVAGVGGLRAQRWADVRNDDRRVDGWIRAGLVRLTDDKGQSAPDRIRQTCCGSRV